MYCAGGPISSFPPSTVPARGWWGPQFPLPVPPQHQSPGAWPQPQCFPFLARPGRRKIIFPLVSTFPRPFGLAAPPSLPPRPGRWVFRRSLQPVATLPAAPRRSGSLRATSPFPGAAGLAVGSSGRLRRRRFRNGATPEELRFRLGKRSWGGGGKTKKPRGLVEKTGWQVRGVGVRRCQSVYFEPKSPGAQGFGVISHRRRKEGTIPAPPGSPLSGSSPTSCR